MSDLQIARQARAILLRSNSPILKATAALLDSYAEQRSIPRYAGEDQYKYRLCETNLKQAALDWCERHNTSIAALSTNAKHPNSLVMDRHHVRRHLCALGFGPTEIGKLFGCDHSTVIYSRDLPQEMLIPSHLLDKPRAEENREQPSCNTA